MREIKFRAYSRGEGMGYFNDLYWFEEHGVHDSSGDGFYSEYVIMQFTGLKDKNGKKIYEGDILKQAISLSGPYLDKVAKVVFYHGSFLAKTTLGAEHQIVENWVEVIGNIYENPELLEKGKWREKINVTT